VSDALLQSLLALRKTCVELKAAVPAPARARLDIMSTVLAKLIVDERDRPGLQEALLAEYAALLDLPYESVAEPADSRSASALDRVRVRLRQALRDAREPAVATTGSFLKKLAQADGAFARACEDAIAAEIRHGEAAGANSDPQNEVFDRSAFRDYLIGALGEDPAVEVANVALASRGFSKKTLLVELRNSRVLPLEVALRVDRAFNFLGTTVSDEFAPLVALHRAGIRLPKPFALESTGKVLDGPFIIFEKRAGSLVGNNFQAPGRNLELAADVAHCLAQVHRTPVEAVPRIHGAGMSAQDQVREDLDKSYADFAALRCPIPVMEAAFSWLYANIDQASGDCGVVHGDYNFNNLLVDGDRVSAIVDWEFLHAGNPAADLGWIHYSAEGICGWRPFLDLYANAGGYRLDPADLQYFILLGQARLGVMTLQTEIGFNEGRFDDLKFGLSGALYTNKVLMRISSLLEALA
jgi:aminoglycoside phosphotransferase (APT) family kinase protein